MKMTDYPDRINIYPVFRQKREDDFYLVDRAAFPGKGTEYVRADLYAGLEAQLAEAKEALQMIDSVVYNDNGDVTYDTGTMGKAHKVARAALAKLEQNEP